MINGLSPKVGELYRLQFEIHGTTAEIGDIMMYVRKTKFDDYVFYCLPKETMVLLSYREIDYVVERVNA